MAPDNKSFVQAVCHGDHTNVLLLFQSVSDPPPGVVHLCTENGLGSFDVDDSVLDCPRRNQDEHDHKLDS
jgi:hypothetical protein